MMERAYTIKDVAEILNCSDWTIRKLVKLNQLEYFRVGNRLRFTEQAISNYIKKQHK